MDQNAYTRSSSNCDSVDGSHIPSPNIFINYLPQYFTKTELVQLCSPYGKIQSAKVMINLLTGQSKGFGFVRYDSIYSAQRAILSLNGMIIPQSNKTLIARYAGSKKENTGNSTNSIYVKSLCLYYSIKDIWKLFSEFGKIKGIEQFVSQKTKKFNGCAIITFSNIHEAEKAVRIMNNIKLTPDSWPLFIQYSEKSANQISDKNNEEFFRGVKIAKPKSKVDDGQEWENYRKSTINESNTFQEKKCNDFNENWDHKNQTEKVSSNGNCDFMFSLIAEEL